MNVEALDKPGWGWFQLWVRPRDGVSIAHDRRDPAGRPAPRAGRGAAADPAGRAAADRRDPEAAGGAAAGDGRRLAAEEAVPAAAARARRARRRGAAHRLRQHRQPPERPGAVAPPRDGAAGGDRRRPLAPRPADAGRERAARDLRLLGGGGLRLVGGALRRLVPVVRAGADPARPRRRLALDGVRHRPHRPRHRAVRHAAGASGLGGRAGRRPAERRPCHEPSAPDPRAHRRAGGLLRLRGVRGGAAGDHVRAPVDASARVPRRPAAGRQRRGAAEPAGAHAVARDRRRGPRAARRRVGRARGLAAARRQPVALGRKGRRRSIAARPGVFPRRLARLFRDDGAAVDRGPRPARRRRQCRWPRAELARRRRRRQPDVRPRLLRRPLAGRRARQRPGPARRARVDRDRGRRR